MTEYLPAAVLALDVAVPVSCSGLPDPSTSFRWQRFRLVVLPQAIRTILPPLGNDFVALVKDSSLVSVLGVADITQLGKVYAASSFRFFETYNVVAFLYLTMTIGLSLALRSVERRLRRRGD